MSAKHWLSENLDKILLLPKPTIDWLLMIWDSIQFFDDVADNDKIERIDLNAVLWNMLVVMPHNQFWLTNAQTLTPVLATMILKWQASDTVERYGIVDATSFVWRAGFYDLVLIAISITHGPDFATKNAHLVMALYGEKLEDYIKEFTHA